MFECSFLVTAKVEADIKVMHYEPKRSFLAIRNFGCLLQIANIETNHTVIRQMIRTQHEEFWINFSQLRYPLAFCFPPLHGNEYEVYKKAIMKLQREIESSSK